ncbi:MAG TPA: hypothetical protein VM243_06965 [Phycisphaerae bacterium]|nr:hypothetical protein [Phycisphaerae bacterium]
MTTPPRVDSYEFGRIEIDGHTYTSDVIILRSGVRGNWHRDKNVGPALHLTC